MPAAIDDKYQQFSRYYAQKHQKRKITICYSLGDAIVAMHVAERPKPHELKVSSLAMFILLMFNEAPARDEGLTIAQIMNALSIDEPSVRKNLVALSTPKVRILQRSSQTTEAASQEPADDAMMIDTEQENSQQPSEVNRSLQERFLVNTSFRSN